MIMQLTTTFINFAFIIVLVSHTNTNHEDDPDATLPQTTHTIVPTADPGPPLTHPFT